MSVVVWADTYDIRHWRILWSSYRKLAWVGLEPTTIYIYISGHKWHDMQSAQVSQKQDGSDIYAIMKIMCPPGYHHNGFVATHALERMMYTSAWVHLYPMFPSTQIHCSYNLEGTLYCALKIAYNIYKFYLLMYFYMYRYLYI